MNRTRLVTLALCLVLIPLAAMAAETIDATPLFDTAANALESAMYGVVSVVVAWVGFFAQRFFGAEVAAKARDTVDMALRNGVNVIMREARLRGRPLAEITVDNPIVALGVQYVVAAVPSALKTLKIGNGELAAKLVARIPVPPAS